MTYDQAVATQHPFGFVITAGDPYFIIDMDRVREGDEWLPKAVDLCARFPGAAREVSRSGAGIHIIGRCDKAKLADRRNKSDGWLEFYTAKRYLAFGPWGWEGNPDLDWTDVLLEVIPQRPEAVTAPAALAWEGPDVADDALVLERLLKARSVTAALDGGVSPADLWNANTAVLARRWPGIGDGEPYDRSCADAALMAHLAFWTNRNPVQMDRLFRRSQLMREKYAEREDYRDRTIKGAIARCGKVADWSPPSVAAAGASALGMVITSDLPAQFPGCVYVAARHAVLMPDGRLLSPDRFKAKMGGREWPYCPEKWTRDAFEAFTQNQLHAFPKTEDLCFRPDMPFGAFVGDTVNTWRGFAIKPDPSASCDLMLAHMRDILFGEHTDWVLDWLADIVQKPAHKPGTAIIIRGNEGAGKDILCDYVRGVLGRTYYVLIEEMKHLFGNFNAHLREALFVHVTDSTWAGDRAQAAKLRAMVTNHRPLIEQKGVDAVEADNFSRFWFTTNNEWAISSAKESRRWFVVEAKSDRIGDRAYFDAIAAEMEGGGPAALLALLQARRITSDLRRAPVTDALTEQRRLTLRGAEGWLSASIEAGELLGYHLAGWPDAPVTGKGLRDACRRPAASVRS
jgi:hypothetical protein